MLFMFCVFIVFRLLDYFANIPNSIYFPGYANSHDYWSEVKRIKNNSTQPGNVVDSLSTPQEISNYFESKYQELYTCFSYDNNEMDQIRRDVYNAFPPADSNCDFIVHFIPKLNSGKSDGNNGLLTHYFKNACADLFIYVSCLFSWKLVHGTVPDDLLTSNVIPIPKGNKKGQQEAVIRRMQYA